MRGRKEIQRILAIMLLSVALAAAVYAAGTAVARETLTIGNTPVGFTPSNLYQTSGTFIHEYAASAYIVVEGNSIRCTEDGTAPTQGASGIGYVMAAGQGREIRGVANVANFKAVAYTSGQSAKVEAVIYYGGE